MLKSVARFLLPACFVTTLSLFALVPSSHAASKVSATTKSNSASIVGTLKNELLAAINADRAAHHVAALTVNAKQSRCSAQHAAKMAASGSLFHTNLATDVCSSHLLVGQNVGEDGGDTSSALLALHTMMIDEGPCPHAGCPGAEYEAHGHYVNILSHAAHHVGIGIVIQNGTLWLTEDFTN